MVNQPVYNIRMYISGFGWIDAVFNSQARRRHNHIGRPSRHHWRLVTGEVVTEVLTVVAAVGCTAARFWHGWGGHCSRAAAAAIRLWWTRACLARWSDRENRLSHTSHPYGLTPECDRQCRDSSSDREKRQVQPGHMHPYGFSPECLLMWTCGRENAL